MTSVETQRVAATAEQIRAFIYRHCHEMSASEIADALGVHIHRVNTYTFKTNQKGDNYNMREKYSVKLHRDPHSFITDH